MKSKVLETIKLRLGISDQDDLLLSYVEEIGERIRHYCNIKEIPEELKHTWTSMTIDALRIEQPNLDGLEETSADGESISIGDTSTAPAKASGLINTAKSTIDQVVLNYRVDLHRYRKLRW